ncbi:hypothetical protein Purlil1_1357 [Purpureocillium lilacinum]|uniref:Uncharacterized protein n=1 Tax=Purpureocillium lilacinum TaxID=33203 RepID=A0ABR0CF46_PURLI|nr:hypothetical protein Purlil1_1357 [Purpureocillium lilacinum]
MAWFLVPPPNARQRSVACFVGDSGDLTRRLSACGAWRRCDDLGPACRRDWSRTAARCWAFRPLDALRDEAAHMRIRRPWCSPEGQLGRIPSFHDAGVAHRADYDASRLDGTAPRLPSRPPVPSAATSWLQRGNRATSGLVPLDDGRLDRPSARRDDRGKRQMSKGGLAGRPGSWDAAAARAAPAPAAAVFPPYQTVGSTARLQRHGRWLLPRPYKFAARPLALSPSGEAFALSSTQPASRHLLGWTTSAASTALAPLSPHVGQSRDGRAASA